MHLHLVRVAARPKQPQRPAKVVVLESRRQARLERRATRAAAPAAGRLRRRAARLLHGLRLFVRMWRNRNTHRSQKPAATGHEGSTPSVRISNRQRKESPMSAKHVATAWAGALRAGPPAPP